jgi:hypothetical protein
VPGGAEAVAEGESERAERQPRGARTHGRVQCGDPAVLESARCAATSEEREREREWKGRPGRGRKRQRAAGGAASGLGERREREERRLRMRAREVGLGLEPYIFNVKETGGPSISRSNAPKYFC